MSFTQSNLGTHRCDEFDVEELTNLAEKGNALAQLELGVLYQFGFYKVKINLTIALFWLDKSFENGNPEAATLLGSLYIWGLSAKLDKEKAKSLFQFAASKGEPIAFIHLHEYFNTEYGNIPDWVIPTLGERAKLGDLIAIHKLAYCYDYGIGVEKDYEISLYYLYHSAIKGKAASEYNIGNYYASQKGVELSFEHSVYWYLKAANQNHTRALHNLSVRYYFGNGVPKDYTKAFEIAIAAAIEFPNSQDVVSNYYSFGIGVEEDLRKGYLWLCKSIANKSCKATSQDQFGKTKQEIIRHLTNEARWELARIVWAGYYRNEGSVLSILPREVIEIIIRFAFQDWPCVDEIYIDSKLGDTIINEAKEIVSRTLENNLQIEYYQNFTDTILPELVQRVSNSSHLLYI